MPRKRRRSLHFDSLVCWLAVYLFLILADSKSCLPSFAVEAFVGTRHSSFPSLTSKIKRLGALNDAARPVNIAVSFPLSQTKVRDTVSVSVRSQRIAVASSRQQTPQPPLALNDVFFPFFSSDATATTTTAPARTNDMSTSQMIAMNAIGGAMTVGVVYALASSNLNGLLTGAATEDFETVGTTIVDAALPMSAADVVTVTFSEAVAAITAAIASLSFSFLLRFTRREKNRTSRVDDIQKAVGNGDFLLAQATALPLLESLGLPPVLTTTVCVIFAAIPAEIVKIASRKSSNKRAAEDKLFSFLLKQEQENKQRQLPFSFFAGKQAAPATPSTEITAEWQETMEQMSRNQEESLLVDIAADVIKWLGYSVLCADLGGQLMYNGLPLFPGLESATFGIIASLSAQVYADILYAYFGFGGEEKQDEMRSRTILSWASTYISEATYAGLFFGIYEFAQIPAMAGVSAFLSGGLESCYGSQDFNMCLQTFESQNPPGASPEAQLRSLVTTVVSLWNRYTPDSLAWT